MEEGLHQPHRSEGGGGAEEGEAHAPPSLLGQRTAPLWLALLVLALAG